MVAEAVVSSAIEKLGDLLVHEGVFLHEVRSQVKWVEEELRSMRAFLKDADTEQKDERVKNWVADIRDAAYDAEDVIDKFIHRIEQRRRRGLVSFFKRFAPVRDEMFDRHELGMGIEQIKNKLMQISGRRLTYGIKGLGEGGEGSSTMGECLQEQRRTSPLLEETEIVGFQEDVKTLVASLIEGDLRRCVISVVGMGGLGKTTLVRKVYNHDAVKKHFNCCACIYVSQEYNVRDLLQSIVRCFMVLTKEHHETNAVQLREMILEHLKRKRYFVVVDDIWKTEAWDALAAAFPDTNQGSRVLLTTRNRDVALYADARSCPHELQLLEKEDSWKLFCKKTFLEQDSSCPTNLERLGKEIVAKCHGLPLAVVVIGGLLSRKASLPSEWEKILKGLSWQFVEGEAQISRVLALSYEDLPYHLKPYFLYLGVYPEDCELSARDLIWLWIAEGFVHSRGAETLEEVAVDCLEELIQRSLIQIVKRSTNGAVKSCRIPDLLRHLSISKAKEENFLNVHSGSINSLSPCRARRLTIHHDIPGYTSLNHSTSYLRSIIWFSPKADYLSHNQQKFVFGGFQLLRVLHLYEIGLKEIPNEIGTLIHLRYLAVVASMRMKRSPPSWMDNLCSLQTLHVFIPALKFSFDVPINIWKMQQLRHVFVEDALTGEGFKASGLTADEDSFPSNLQTLKTIWAGDWIEDCLGKLINLRKLGITGVDLCRHGKGLFDSIPKLVHLQSLTLKGESLYQILPFLYQLHLYNLCLDGRLGKLPESHEFSSNLTKLTLERSFLRQDPMMTLEKLMNLRILRLHSSFLGKEMVCSAQGFPRLESLEIKNLDDLQRWRVDEGAMPSLLHLHIFRCGQLKMLPDGLQHVTTLRKLELTLMSQRFINRLRKDEGEDWHKIQHIPSIDIKGSY